MEIYKTNPKLCKNAALILGFFDGIHLGHREVIKSATDYAKINNTKSILLTFNLSPAEYFQGSAEYIYPRDYSYKLIEKIGVDYLIESDFSKLVNITAQDYLKELVENYHPISISTGFNHSFGARRSGTPDFLEQNSQKYGFKYFCISPYKIDNEIVSSTNIKEKLACGMVDEVRTPLGAPFTIEGKVIKGAQLGRRLGFPTANIKYPEKIIKLPYGVYAVKALDMPAILNWGIKPTVDGTQEILEVHIPNYNNDLYDKNIKIEFVKRIRNEMKFNSLEELKLQIAKDVEICLKL